MIAATGNPGAEIDASANSASAIQMTRPATASRRGLVQSRAAFALACPVMRTAALALAVVLMLSLLGLPAQAGAKKSTGLYAPFPSLNGSGYLQRYVGDFGVEVPKARLETGAEISGRLVPAADTQGPAPSARIAPSKNITSGLVFGAFVALISGGLFWGLLHWRRVS
jgi:hypothetical protein